jgi:hypothetical protein
MYTAYAIFWHILVLAFYHLFGTHSVSICLGGSTTQVHDIILPDLIPAFNIFQAQKKLQGRNRAAESHARHELITLSCNQPLPNHHCPILCVLPILMSNVYCKAN